MKKFTETKLFYAICELIFNITKIIMIFKKDKPNKYECINCKKIFDKPQECQCGGTKYVINPRKYNVEGNQILCGCKKGELEHYCHYDCYDGFIEEYICSRCANTISIYYYMEYEEDDYKYKRYEMNKFLDENVSEEDNLLKKMPWNI